MDYLQSFAISAAGMKLERTRVDVAALNLANASTIQAPDGTAYQPMRVVARSAAAQGAQFASFVEQAVGQDTRGSPSIGVLPMLSVEPANAAPRSVYEPGNPLANERGFVTYPGVDPATEMMTLMTATRAYEANVAAMNTARSLALKALEIGGK